MHAFPSNFNAHTSLQERREQGRQTDGVQGWVLPLPHIRPRASKGTGAVSSAVKSHVRAHPQGLLLLIQHWYQHLLVYLPDLILIDVSSAETTLKGFTVLSSMHDS